MVKALTDTFPCPNFQLGHVHICKTFTDGLFEQKSLQNQPDVHSVPVSNVDNLFA